MGVQHRSSDTNRWLALLLILAATVVLLGTFGYLRYLPTPRPSDVIFHGLNLLALNFQAVPGTPVPWELNAARFLAHGVAALAIVLAVIGLARRRFEGWHATRWSRHVVVVGGGHVAQRIATAYRDSGTRVVLVATLPAERQEVLRRRGVRVVADAGTTDSRTVLDGAQRLVLAGANDDDTLHRFAQLLPQLRTNGTAALHVLVEGPDLAAELRNSLTDDDLGQIDVCGVAERTASAMLQRCPPREEGMPSHPPVVVGEGDVAKELVRRLVRGWYRPGDPMQVLVLGLPEAEVDELRAELHGVGVLATAAEASSLTEQVAAIEQHVAGRWTVTADPKDDREHGPAVLLAGLDDAVAIVLVRRLAKRVPSARIAALVDEPEQLTALVQGAGPTPGSPVPLLTRSLVTQPATLETGRTELLAEAFYIDQQHWRDDLPSIFGAAARNTTTFHQLNDRLRAPFLAVAETVDGALEAAGLEVARSDGTPPVLLPDELVTIEAALPSFELDVDEAVERHLRLEFVAQLPALLARIGDDVRRVDERDVALSNEKIEHMAPRAHDAYRKAQARPGGITDSPVAGLEWSELTPFLQESNRAQVRDIAVKLASANRMLCAVAEADADDQWLNDEEIERLARWEHRRWEHLHLRAGYRPGPTTDREVGSHRSMQAWEDLGPEQELDRNAVRSIPALLESVGLATHSMERPR